MSSAFDVFANYGIDTFTPKIKQLRQEVIRERTKNLDLESESLRAEGRNSHAVVRLDDERLKFITTLPANNLESDWELPFEPDGTYLTLWFMFDHLGRVIKDISGFNNVGFLFGHPTMHRSTLNMGFMQNSADPAFPAIIFNSGLDVVGNTTGECCLLNDSETLQFTNYPNGFSVCFRFHAFDFSSDPTNINGGVIFRRFAAKRDDNDNGFVIALDDGGDLIFHVYDDATWYKFKIDNLSLDTWYDVVMTYDPAGSPRVKIYLNAVESAVTDELASFVLPSIGITFFHIGCTTNNGVRIGFFRGYIQDFRIYMDKVLTQTEVTNLYTNKMTIENIPHSKVAIVNYFTVDPEPTP